MRAYAKTPADTLRVTLDFTEFVAENADATITYELRADLGVVVQADSSTPGVFLLTVDGGVAGRAYGFGIEATAAYEDGSQGDSSVQLCRVRLREVPTWDGVPVVGEVGIPTNFFLLIDADGNALVDDAGNALVIAG